VHCGDAARDREAEAVTTSFAGACFVHAVKALA
jgi:hypothetical protein